MLPRGPFEVGTLFGVSSGLVGQGRRLVWQKSVGGSQKAPLTQYGHGQDSLGRRWKHCKPFALKIWEMYTHFSLLVWRHQHLLEERWGVSVRLSAMLPRFPWVGLACSGSLSATDDHRSQETLSEACPLLSFTVPLSPMCCGWAFPSLGSVFSCVAWGFPLHLGWVSLLAVGDRALEG